MINKTDKGEIINTNIASPKLRFTFLALSLLLLNRMTLLCTKSSF